VSSWRFPSGIARFALAFNFFFHWVICLFLSNRSTAHDHQGRSRARRDAWSATSSSSWSPCRQLERSIAALSRTKYAIGCASGTDAILPAIRALDISRGDGVITTPFTFFATAGTVHNVGATPCS
jgi:hypothetical protein